MYEPDDYIDEDEMEQEPVKSGVTEPLVVELPPDVIDRLLDNVASRLAGSLMKKATERIDKMLDELFETRIEAAMAAKCDTFMADYMAKPRRKTNKYGEPVPGEASESFSEIVMAGWNGYLIERVDSSGNSTGSSYSKECTRVEWIIKKYAMEHLVEESKKAAAMVSAEAKKVVQASVAQYIAEQLTPSVRVNPMQLK